MTCLVRDCTAPAVATASQRSGTPPGFCALHYAYVMTVLADDRYRTEKPPEVAPREPQRRLPL